MNTRVQLIRGAFSGHGMPPTTRPARCTITSHIYPVGQRGVVKKWLGDRTEKFTARDMAELVLNLTEKGIGGSLNKEETTIT